MNHPKIIICRHAESIEDVDKTSYDTLSDLDMPLTENGVQQAHEFGINLSRLLAESLRARFYTSPGVRNKKTLEVVLSKLPASLSIDVKIEPLIVKQDWGKITVENRPLIEADRYRTGVLRYTFPTGESAKNMIERLILFKEKVFTFQKKNGCDIVIFSHGFEFRVLLMIIFGWDEETFESFGNLANCEYRILTQTAEDQYVLDRPLKQHGLPITRLKQSVQ